MKAQLTALASSVRGKVAGTTFRNVGGSTILTTTSASLPGRISIAPQMQVNPQTTYIFNPRGTLQFVGASWRTLSNAERSLWQQVSINNQKGYHAFVAANYSRQICLKGIAILRTPSAALAPRMGPIRFTFDPPVSLYARFPPFTGPADSYVAYYFSRPLPASSTSNRKRLQLLRTFRQPDTFLTISTFLRYYQGTLQPSMRYFYRFETILLESGRRLHIQSGSFIPNELPTS